MVIVCHIIAAPFKLLQLQFLPSVLPQKTLLVHLCLVPSVLLYELRQKPILSIDWLYNVGLAVSDRGVVAHRNILECLYQFALDVSYAGSLDCSVREALATCHRVEKELMRLESLVEGACDKASWDGRVVVLIEVGKRPFGES